MAADTAKKTAGAANKMRAARLSRSEYIAMAYTMQNNVKCKYLFTLIMDLPENLPIAAIDISNIKRCEIKEIIAADAMPSRGAKNRFKRIEAAAGRAAESIIGIGFS